MLRLVNRGRKEDRKKGKKDERGKIIVWHILLVHKLFNGLDEI